MKACEEFERFMKFQKHVLKHAVDHISKDLTEKSGKLVTRKDVSRKELMGFVDREAKVLREYFCEHICTKKKECDDQKTTE